MKFRIENYGPHYFLEVKDHWWSGWKTIYQGPDYDKALRFKEHHKKTWNG